MDNPHRIALAVFALGTVQAIALLILIASGGGSSFADRQTRAQIIPATYAPAGGSP